MSGAEPVDSPEPGPASYTFRQQSPDRRTCVLTIEGELDIASVAELKQQLQQPLSAGYRKIVLDLAGVRFIDSTALGVLVEVNYERRLLAGEGLVMTGLRPSVLKVFEVTGLEGSFDIAPDVESALSQVREQASEAD